MNGKFRHLEMVRVKAGVELPKKTWDLTGEIGIVVGWADPGEDGRRVVAVHWNKYGESIALCEDKLEAIGHVATREQLVTRSRAHQRRKLAGEEGKY